MPPPQSIGSQIRRRIGPVTELISGSRLDDFFQPEARVSPHDEPWVIEGGHQGGGRSTGQLPVRKADRQLKHPLASILSNFRFQSLLEPLC